MDLFDSVFAAATTPHTLMLPLPAREHEDMMLEVMDQLVGHCQRTQRILPRPEPGDADYGIR